MPENVILHVMLLGSEHFSIFHSFFASHLLHSDNEEPIKSVFHHLFHLTFCKWFVLMLNFNFC